MATFVLVHGSWHGAWCWYHVATRLRNAGHRVLAPDLAGLGADRTALTEVTLARWRDDVCRAIDQADERVVLVGHSRGGLLISESAEARPDRIVTLVYLAAFLVRDGETLLDVSALDGESLIRGNLEIAPNGLSANVRDAVIDEAFYAQCPAEDIVLARMLLQPEPLAPLATPARLTPERYGRVHRIYIECLNDRAVTPSAQRRMYTATPCAEVITMHTDHSPFFSAPDELTTHLTRIAAVHG